MSSSPSIPSSPTAIPASAASPTALSTSSSSTTVSSAAHSLPGSSTSATTPEPLQLPSGAPLPFPSDGMPQHLSQPPPPRRKASFYPHALGGKQNKPFSRSAAKRESVMMLGSIEHLQHYFTKQGLQAKQKPGRIQSQFVPAIGPSFPPLRPGNSSNPLTPSNSAGLGPELPPSPAVPPPRPQVVLSAVSDVREKHDPALLRREVLRALDEVEALWALEPTISAVIPEQQEQPNGVEGVKREMDESVDVVHSLLRTTHLVRSVRNYLVSLPPSSNSPPPPPQLSTFRANNLTPQPVQRQRITSASSVTSASGGGASSTTDPSARIRRAALDLLANLRLFEEGARLGPAEGAGAADEHDHDHDVSSDVSSLGLLRAVSPSGLPSRGPTPLPPDDQAEDDGEEKKREAWDERLVLGGGFLYRMDVKLADCESEREAVGKYLAIVDQVLFNGGKEDGGRGWRSVGEREPPANKRRVSGSSVGMDRRPPVGPVAGRRVVSAAGLLESSLGGVLTEEPEDMASPGEELDAPILGGIAEGDEEEPIEMILEEEEEEEEDADASSSSQDESSLPDWAQTAAFSNLPDRLRALLAFFLPSSLQEHLPPTSPADAFWLGLQSGQLLCVAYNASVRRSSKPWGYIEARAIHDIIALDLAASQPPLPPAPQSAAPHPLHHAIGPQFTGQRQHHPKPPAPEPEPIMVQHTGGSKQKEGGWTFRRTENLRLFAAACKLRYLIPFVSTMPAPAPGGKAVEAVLFDPKAVANKTEGWQAMLESAVSEWMARVVRERREQAGRP